MPVSSSSASSRTGDQADAAREILLELRHLSAGYGDRAVVHDLCITVGKGEIVALLGANGAGKSTTLLAAVGELPPLSGEVRWLDSPVSTSLHQRARQGLAFVPEDRSVLRSMSVRDNLLLGPGGIDPAIVLFPELRILLSKRAGLLSGGEQQMLTLGRALAANPKLLVLDEISLGLAPVIIDRLFGALRVAAARDGVAVLLVEQRARRAMQIADRWYLLRRGSISSSGDSRAGLTALEEGYFGASLPTEPT
jgi:branched-chain amino acid transport system ATP-binding protein